MPETHVIDDDKLAYSVADAARLLSVSDRTIFAYLTQGSLQSVKMGRRRLIRRAELIRFLDCAKAA